MIDRIKSGKKICVLAFPRSGTKWIAEYFQNCGFDVGHESWGKNGGVGYMMAAEKLENAMSADAIIHLIRNPSLCIPSAKANLGVNHEVYKASGGDWDDAWIHWNLRFEEIYYKAANAGKYVRRLRLPVYASVITEIIKVVFGVDDEAFLLAAPPSIINHRRDYELLEQLKPGVAELAKRYGY